MLIPFLHISIPGYLTSFWFFSLMTSTFSFSIINSRFHKTCSSNHLYTELLGSSQCALHKHIWLNFNLHLIGQDMALELAVWSLRKAFLCFSQNDYPLAKPYTQQHAPACQGGGTFFLICPMG